jgi:hypothetical protein
VRENPELSVEGSQTIIEFTEVIKNERHLLHPKT